MSTTVWSSTGGTTVTQSLADQAATSATAAASSATLAATSATEAAASATSAANAATGLKVSSDDQSPSTLEDKLIAGTGVSFTTNNSGANETRTINVSGFQATDATLTALAGLTVSADQLIYATGSDAFATSSITSAGRALLDDADAAAQRQTLSAQEADATLTALAGVSVGADQLIYATGSDAFATASLTSAGRALIDDSDVATMRGTLGLGTAATSASSAFLASASPSVSSGTLTLTSSGLTFSDGTTQTTASSGGGGGGGLSNVVDDTSPELGGNLDVLARSIVSSSGRDISLSPDGTGSVIIKGGTAAAKLQLECEQGSHSTSIQSPPHSASADYTLTLPTSLSAGALYTSSGGQLSTGDLPVADGGTGASDQAGAQQNLGLQIGTNILAYDAGLNSIAGLTTAADKMIYTTGSDTYAVTTITAAGRAILDDADASAQKATLGLEIGTDILAYDAGLNSIAGLTTAADKMIYTTGSDTYAVADLSAQARSLLDDADAAAMRTTLGLGTMATAATSDYLALAGGTLSGTLVAHSSGVQFSDGTTQTTAATAGVSTGKAIAMAMVFG
jgi:hypothetical protein